MIVETCGLSSGMRHVLTTSERSMQIRMPQRHSSPLAIVGNSVEPEARCICQILREMLKQQLFEEVMIIYSLDFPSGDFYSEVEHHGLPPVFGPDDEESSSR